MGIVASLGQRYLDTLHLRSLAYTSEEALSESTDSPDFSKGDGLLPAIAQDAETGEVLMMAYMNPESYAESVVERMSLYREQAGSKPIRAYVNVGGGTSSVGTRRSKYAFQPGINTRTPPRAALIDSVMARFLDEGVPVIHFLQINRMAQRYGLPVSPQVMPPVGAGQVFLLQHYNRSLAAFALAIVIGSVFLFLRSGRIQMILGGGYKAREKFEASV